MFRMERTITDVSRFSTSSISDHELPSGSIDGVNAIFTLSHSPNPVLSLNLVLNGVGLTQNLDFTIVGATITVLGTAIPHIGDTFTASYRY